MHFTDLLQIEKSSTVETPFKGPLKRDSAYSRHDLYKQTQRLPIQKEVLLKVFYRYLLDFEKTREDFQKYSVDEGLSAFYSKGLYTERSFERSLYRGGILKVLYREKTKKKSPKQKELFFLYKGPSDHRRFLYLQKIKIFCDQKVLYRDKQFLTVFSIYFILRACMEERSLVTLLKTGLHKIFRKR